MYFFLISNILVYEKFLGGGSEIDKDLQESIGLYLKHHSRIASNRTTTNKSIEMPVRYLDNSKIELYKNYPYKDSVSKSTFLKYLNANKIYKKVSCPIEHDH